MAKLWLFLGAISLCMGVAGYVYQDVVRHSMWSWSQVITTETAVSVTISVGIVLLFVALVDYKRSGQ